MSCKHCKKDLSKMSRFQIVTPLGKPDQKFCSHECFVAFEDAQHEARLRKNYEKQHNKKPPKNAVLFKHFSSKEEERKVKKLNKERGFF